MDQISPPFRIAIAAMLAVCALWFTVLKPKPPAGDAPLPTAPGVTGLASDVNAAKGAAATSDAASAKVQAATGGTPAKTATPATGAHAAVAGKSGAAPATGKAKAARSSTDPSAPLLSAVDGHRAVVLLFWNRKAADDRAVRHAVAATARRHGKVVVKTVAIAQVARYGAITRGAQVLQSPTTLVIAPGRTARAIVGLTSTAEIDQAVGDALAGK